MNKAASSLRAFVSWPVLLLTLTSLPSPALGQKSPPPGITVAANGSAAGNGWTVPRTPDGQPDLQGIWTNTTITPLERPLGLGAKQFFTEREAAEYEKAVREGKLRTPRETADDDVVGAYDREVWSDAAARIVSSRRTSLLVDPPDGQLPIRPDAEEQRRYNRAHQTDSYDYQTSWIRCITRGVPGGMLPTAYNNGYQILQTPGYVVIVTEMLREARIIPLDGRPHVTSNIRLWIGDSRGHWEGETLVVDTTNFNHKVINELGRKRGIPQSEALHVIERFTRTGAGTLQYDVTVSDPKVYTSPWKAEVPFHKDNGYQILEYACHEGNYSMANMLAGARAQEKAAAEKAAGDSSR